MRRRPLSPEEEELWHRVAETVLPLHPCPPRPTVALAEPKPRPAPEPVVEQPVTPPRPAPTGLVRMDAKTQARMKRGKLAPEARIDLHGMTLAEAHPRLTAFVLGAQASGLRLVLVITGKGRGSEDWNPIPQHPGVLRRQVPHWLRLPPLAPAVLEVTEAHLRHGGAGAFYVYLRRAR